MQKLEIKTLLEELHAMKNTIVDTQDNRMPETEERKMLSNAQIKSTIEGKEDVIMTFS